MGLSITRTRLDFQSPNGLTPYTEIVTGGLAPYTAASSNVNVITVAQATSPNLATHSDDFSTWGLFGGAVLANGGPGGAKDCEFTGTGTAVAAGIQSPQISVSPNQTYVLSCWVSPPASFSGSVQIEIHDVTNNTFKGSGTTITPGASPFRYSITWTSPANAGTITILLTTNSATIVAGEIMKWSQPMFTVQGYDPNTYISQTSAWTVNPKYRGSATITYTDSTP